ncbi:histidine kinase [Angustibacter sp. McL0619]|uniref:sensor histidine kinase n=1 Tax=Angustibacter sp. McL0619 TaxID=3415676 RepID=UPI003CEA63D9
MSWRARAALPAAALLAVAGLITAAVILAHRDDPGVAVAFGLLSVWLGVAFGAVGAFLLGVRPGNLLGPVLFISGASLVAEYGLRSYAYVGIEASPDALPAAAAAGWAGMALDPLFFPVSLVVTLLLFPDGRLPSRWWRAVLTACLVVTVGHVLALALRPGPIDDESFGYQIPWSGALPTSAADRVSTVSDAATVALLALIPVAVVKLVRDYRRAGRLARQQFRPLLFVAGLLVVGLALQAVPRTTGLGIAVIVGGVTLGFPAALAVASLHYRLWDLDRLLVAAIVYAALAGLATVGYVVVVVGVARATGATSGSGGLGAAVVGTALVALAFAPARDRLSGAARRLVYGVRATPYEALAALPHRLAEAPEVDDVLPQTARVLAEGLGVPAARARAFLPDGDQQVAWWPAGDGADVGSAELTSIEVRHLGEVVGDISVRASADRPLGSADRRLLSDLGAQAGPALRGVGLAAMLRAQLDQITRQSEDLRASRERLASAQVAERRRIERDIHDGAQHELVGLAVRLAAADELVMAGDPQAHDVIIESRAAVERCIGELRELGRGIFPPVLAARGLVSALRGRARSASGNVQVVAGPGSESARVEPGIELAVYFCCMEALQNAAKHAPGARVVVHLEITAAELRFAVADEGSGLRDMSQASAGTGLVGMQDRLGAVGGVLNLTSSPARGTTISGRIPLHGLAPS